MKQTIKRAFSRPYQMAAHIGLAVCLYQLMPDTPPLHYWAYYLGAWGALLLHGFDSYAEGFDRGVAIMNRLER